MGVLMGMWTVYLSRQLSLRRSFLDMQKDSPEEVAAGKAETESAMRSALSHRETALPAPGSHVNNCRGLRRQLPTSDASSADCHHLTSFLHHALVFSPPPCV